eukprot:NODE_8846_length_236_cov_123.711230_g8231_i0.p1 GENE.NODE_8846_length_236_cov_123.711230_g8231_i0~~NODE_8846_length_236_cov_123.711230_g8231_i0.p1  ORF type:complete len:60 (+),score=17.66 NODE_8846_length_236_cov_123.711230_g8231_i0:25-180(+)
MGGLRKLPTDTDLPANAMPRLFSKSGKREGGRRGKGGAVSVKGGAIQLVAH